MNIKIINKEIKQDGKSYYLEMVLSDFVNNEWERAYQQSLLQESYYSSRGGGPVINRITFEGEIARTTNFPEYSVKADLPEFLKEFERRLEIANSIYNGWITLRQQQQEAKKQKEIGDAAKLQELNRILNNQDKD